MSARGEEPRIQWVGKLEYLMTSIGYVVGIGNFWRFPHRCFVNGGGAFFIPYLIAVVFCVVPMIFLELFLGQFASEGAITIWKFCPIFKGIGWAMIFNLLMMNTYYAVIVMYAFYYMVVSFVNIGGTLPWQECPDGSNKHWSTDKCSLNPFPDDIGSSDEQKIEILYRSRFMDQSCLNTTLATVVGLTYETFKQTYRHCMDYRSPEDEYWNRFVLGVGETNGIHNLGDLLGRNVVCLFIVWLFVFYSCLRGIRSIAKVVYVTATFPVLLMLILFVRAVTLPGHDKGIEFYTAMDWPRLGEMDIWASATTQAIYSYGPAFGTHIVLASYNKFHNNCFRDGILQCVANLFTSVFGGFIVFSFLGNSSSKLNVDIDNMTDNGPGIMFIYYIQGISQLPHSSVWTFLFCMMVFTLGLDSLIAMVWTVHASLADVFPTYFARYNKILLAVLCLLHFLLALPLVTQGGIHFVVLMDNYSATFNLVLFLVVESLAVCLIYGLKNFVSDIEMMIGKGQIFVQWCLRIMWLVTTPVFCAFILIATAISFKRSSYADKKVSAGGEAIGWLLIVTPIVIVIGYIVYMVVKDGRPRTFGDVLRKLKEACIPDDSWGPRLEGNRTGRYCKYLHPIADQTSAYAMSTLDERLDQTIDVSETEARIAEGVTEAPGLNPPFYCPGGDIGRQTDIHETEPNGNSYLTITH